MTWDGGVEQEINEHHVRHRAAAGGGSARGCAGEAQLRNRRVNHPASAELLPQTFGVGEAAAALANAFAEVKDMRIAAHLLGDAVAHRFEVVHLDAAAVG